MKKSSLLASSIISLMLLSGCNTGFQGGSSASAPTSVPEMEISAYLPTFDTTQKITINFWHTMGDNLQTALNEIIVEFNKAYPNIEVVHTQIGSYPDVRDNVLKGIPVNSTPHLAYCYPDHVALYRDARAVEVLDEYIYDSNYGLTVEQRNDFVPGFYAEGKTFGDNKMYSLPFVKSTEVLYYNATYLAKNNIQVPTTWDELWAACEAIKAKDNKIVPLGYDSEANWFITNAEQNGYGYTTTDLTYGKSGQFLFNNEGNRNFVTDLKAKYEKGLFTTETMYGAYTSGLFTSQGSVFGIGSTGGAGYQWSKDFETGIAQLPQTKGGKNAVISQGPSICMLSKDNQQEEIASWLFLRFLTTDVASQAKFAEASGYIPVTKSAQNAPSYKTYLEGASGTTKEGTKALAAKVAVEQSDKYFTSPTFVGSSQARDEVGNIIVNVLKGTAVQDAFDAAVQSCIEAVS